VLARCCWWVVVGFRKKVELDRSSSEISLNPYLLKVLINTVIQYSHDQTKLVAAIAIPAAIYIALPMIINVVLRFFQYISLHLYPYIKGTSG